MNNRVQRLIVPGLLLSLFLFSAVAAEKEPADAVKAVPGNMKLFLLIGQSNMAGRGKVEPQDQETNPRIFMFNQKREWVLAKDPVHFDKSMAGVGLCSEFARQVVKKDPKITVGLIPCAMGGSSLNQWMPDGKPGSLYSNAVERTKLALQDGELAGILWHQGESDSGKKELVESYNDRFAEMIKQLRKDLNAEDVPVIVGEVCNKSQFNKVVCATPEKVPNCAWVSAEGCANDGLHFKREGYLLLGQRYAEKYQELSSGRNGKAGSLKR